MISTQALSASGPNAQIQLSGQDITVGGAITATAGHGGTATGSSMAAFFQTGATASPTVTSNFGFASVNFSADATSGTAISTQSVSVSGPTALLSLNTGADIAVNGTLSATGLGYTVSGNASQLPAFQTSTPSFVQQPVLLNTGSTTWGAGEIDIGNSNNTAGNLGITGGITVSGLGQSDVNVNATGISVTGAVSVTGHAGSVQGTETSFIQAAGGTSSTEGYNVTRTYSNGGNGAASVGEGSADFRIAGTGGSTTLGSLTVHGTSDAEASFKGGDNVTINGNATIDGELAGTAAIYDEAVSFAPTGGAPALANGDTRIVGGLTALSTGFNNGTLNPIAGTFTASGVTLDGFGFVGLALESASQQPGVLKITQGAGSFFSSDPTRVSTTVSLTDAGAAVLMGHETAQAQTNSITINAVGPVALGVDAILSGNFDLTAESVDNTVPGVLLGFNLPGLDSVPSGFASGPVRPNLTLAGLAVSAGSIDLAIAQASSLPLVNLLSTVGASSIGAPITTPGNLVIKSVGNVKTSDLTGATVSVTSTAGGIQVGAVTTSAGSAGTANSLIPPAFLLAANGISAGNIQGFGMSVESTTGSISLGNTTIGNGNYHIAPDTTSNGFSLTVGNVTYTGSSGIAFIEKTTDPGFNPNFSFSYTFGTINAASVDFTLAAKETVKVGKITSPGAVTLATNTGALSFGSISGSNISISRQTGGLSFDKSSLTTGGTLSVAAGGAIKATDSLLQAPTITVSGIGLTLSGDTVAGGSKHAGANSITLSGGTGALGLSSTSVFGNAIQLSGGSVSLTSAGVFGGSTSTVDGALHATGAKTISVTSSSGNIQGTNVTLGGGSISLTAANGLGLTSADIQGGSGNAATSVGMTATKGAVNLSGLAVSAQTATVSGSTGASLTNVNFGGNGSGLSKSINVSSKTGTLALNGAGLHAQSVVLGNAGDITIAGGTLNGSSANASIQVTSTQGSVTLGADSLAKDALLFSQSISLGGKNVTVASSKLQGNSAGAAAKSVALTAGTGALKINTASVLNAATNTLKSSGTAAIDSSTIDGNTTLTSTGATSINKATLLGASFSATGGSGLTLSGGTLIAGNDSGGGATSVTLSGGTGALAVTSSTLFGKTIQLSGASLSLGSNALAGGSNNSADAKHQKFGANQVTLSSATGSIVDNGSDLFGNNISLTGAKNVSLTKTTLAGGSSADATSIAVTATKGTLALSGATLNGKTDTLSGSSGAALTNGTSVGTHFGQNAVINLSNTTGTMSVSDSSLKGKTITLSNGGDISVSGGKLLATSSGSVSVTASGGNAQFTASSSLVGGTVKLTGNSVTVSGSSIAGSTDGGAASAIALTAKSGDIDITSASALTQQNLTATAAGDFDLDGSTITGAAVPIHALHIPDGVRPKANNPSSVSITGTNILFKNGSSLSANSVSLSAAAGSITASGTSLPTIDAGALSASAGSIDLSGAQLTVGSGTASFGSDSQLLSALGSRASATGTPLVPHTTAPNAAFSATAGGVKLGTVSFTGTSTGYLFAQGATFAMQSASAPEGSPVFINFLPANTKASQTFNGSAQDIGVLQPPTGVSTFVFGGSPESGDFFIGDGTQTFKISNANLVFDTSGITHFPQQILASNGAVIVLGQSVNNVIVNLGQDTIDEVPLVQNDYRPEPPDIEGQDIPRFGGDINDDGVNNANRGRIDQSTSQQPALNCSVGGAQ